MNTIVFCCPASERGSVKTIQFSVHRILLCAECAGRVMAECAMALEQHKRKQELSDAV